MNKLTFDELRAANVARLPQFKNNNGQPAHDKPDGSDWSVAEWFQAMVGEMGEYARVRCDFELGTMPHAEMAQQTSKELPDIAIYLDLLALRSLDKNETYLDRDAAFVLMQLMAALGEYANAAKKFIRGDINALQFKALKFGCLQEAKERLSLLITMDVDSSYHTVWNTYPSAAGVNLGDAVLDKFNATSIKVGSTVLLKARPKEQS